MFCKNCGKELPNEVTFCPNCGFKLEENTKKEVPKTDRIIWKYIGIKGRLNRKSYIIRTLIAGIVQVCFFVLFLGFREPPFMNVTSALLAFLASFFCLYISFCGFLITLSAAIRRLHDLDHTGWLCLLAFIPIIDLCLVIYLIFKKGTEGDNRYGSSPLAQ